MLTDEHIFTIKTKDSQNVADIQRVATNVTISGLNVLKDKIQVGDLVFVVLGGDHPEWETGLVGLALISAAPFDDGYDGRRNFRVNIDIKTYFAPITRGDLVTYPDTFDIIGIGPITKWEPNQAITSVGKDKAIGLLQAICDLRPSSVDAIKEILGNEYEVLPKDIRRYANSTSLLGSKVPSINAQTTNKSGTRKLSDAFADDEMLKRLAAALRTKPFAILAGHSGTGKSQLVRRLAYMTCNNELLAKEGEGKTAPGNYCMVQVKPNWHDSSDLLGYYSEMGGRHFVNTPFVQFVCKAYAYPDTPFFVCLDEMNLAPVEQYFAEYLSAIESLEKKGADWVTDPLVEVDKDGETIDPEILGQIMKGAESTEAAAWIQSHGLTIPKNLFVIGTVNMDETTCQFSRKVLDRAMTLLMNTVSFADMATGKKPSEEELLDDDGVKFFLEGDVRGEVGAIEGGLLDGINEPLKNTAFVVAYRFANEYALYEAAWAKLKGVNLATAAEEDKKQLASEALDQVVLMKLLPRIHGEKAAVKAIFEGGKRDGKETPGLKGRLPAGGLSVGMMDDILARGDEYLTFWP